MSNKLSTWKINFWYGGFSDDRFLGIQNSFRYAKGIEIRKNPNSIKLAWNSLKISGDVVEDLILSAVTIKSTGDTVFFGDAGNIYIKSSGTDSPIKVFTDPTDRKIINSFEYNGDIYWATASKLHKISVADAIAQSDWTSYVTLDYKTFSNGNSNAHPMIELFNNLYIGDGYYLSELSSLGVFTGNKISIFHDEEIRALTFIGTIMRIYSRKSNLSDYGSQYLWDGTSENYNQRNIWNGTTIHTAITGDDGQDYVIAGKRPYIYATSGYERSDLKRIPLIEDGEYLSISPNAISIFDGLIAIGFGESGSNSVGRGIWTYGRLDNKYPYSLNFDYPTSNDNTTDVIGCVHQSNGVLFQTWKNGDSYGIDMIDTSHYRATGELISRTLYGEDPADVKECRSTQLAFKQISDGEKIDIYFAKNLGEFLDEPSMSIDYNIAAHLGKNEKKKYAADEIGDFNFLDVKTILTAGTDLLTSPEVMGISVNFNSNIERGDE